MKLLERNLRSQYHLLAQRRSVRNLALGYGLDRLAIWMLSIALSVTVYLETESIAAVAVLLLVYIIARIGVAWYSPFEIAGKPPMMLTTMVARILATASLVLVSGSGDLRLTLLAFAVVAGATGALEKSFHYVAPRQAELGQLPTINALVRSVEQICAFLGPLLAGVILLMFNDGAVAAVATVLLLTSLVPGIRTLAIDHEPRSRHRAPFALPRSLTDQIRPYGKLRVVVTGLLFGAAIGVLVRVALVDVAVNRLEFASGYYGVLIAFIGLGALFGPVPVDKLLGHLSVESIFTGGMLALGTGAVVAVTTGHVLLIVSVLLGSGALVVTLDVVASVALRRLVPVDELPVVDAVLLRAVLFGQVAALGVVIAFSLVWSVSIAAMVVSVIAGIVMAVLFVTGGGSLFAWQMISASRTKTEARRNVTC